MTPDDERRVREIAQANTGPGLLEMTVVLMLVMTLLTTIMRLEKLRARVETLEKQAGITSTP